MKAIFALVLSLTTAVPAFANPPNNELGLALANLQGKVTVVDHSFVAKTTDYAWSAATAGVNAMGFLVFFGATGAVHPIQKKLMAVAVGVSSVASVAALVGSATLWMRKKPVPRAPSYYDSKEKMDEFFALDIDDQYAIASRDPSLAQFILDLNAAFERVNNGFPARGPEPVVPGV